MVRTMETLNKQYENIGTDFQIDIYHIAVFNKLFRRLREKGNLTSVKSIRPYKINGRGEKTVINALIDNTSSNTQRVTQSPYKSQFCIT